jgi:copper chaperone CopZ
MDAGRYSNTGTHFHRKTRLAMEHTTLTIGGMSCQHCVRAVREALTELPGVELAHVDVGSAELSYDPELQSVNQIKAAVVDAGYTIA